MLSSNILLGFLFGLLLGTFLIWLASTLVIVEEKTYKTTVFLGSRFNRILLPGLNLKWPFPFESVDKIMNTRIRQLPVTVTSVTKDKATVEMNVRVQWVPNPDKYYEAAYILDDPQRQISSYIENSIRAAITNMNLENVFSSTDLFEDDVKALFNKKFSGYGYNIVNILIDQPQIPTAMVGSYILARIDHFKEQYENHRHDERSRDRSESRDKR